MRQWVFNAIQVTSTFKHENTGELAPGRQQGNGPVYEKRPCDQSHKKHENVYIRDVSIENIANVDIMHSWFGEGPNKSGISKMTNSEMFKKAHRMTKNAVRRFGGDYMVTFSQCLKIVINGIKKATKVAQIVEADKSAVLTSKGETLEIWESYYENKKYGFDHTFVGSEEDYELETSYENKVLCHNLIAFFIRNPEATIK